MSSIGNWCLIESDPAVFTELIRGFGAQELECDEVYDLKEIDRVSDAVGLIFLFKWDGQDGGDGHLIPDARSKNLFFAKQVITNACATQAIINILLNLDENKVDLGNTLKEFKAFVADFDSWMKGTALSNSDQIRTVHNSFSNYQIFDFEEKVAKKEEDVYHFVGYVPVDGVLYELDGLKEGPIEHGKVPEHQSWLSFVTPILQKRMDRCLDGNFNLLAVVPNRLSMYQKQLAQLHHSTDGSRSNEVILELQRNIEKEQVKFISYRQENIRRRHNYLPLTIELMKILAENSIFVDAVTKAKKTAQERKVTKKS